MPDQKPTLEYAKPHRRRWPWWADVLFAIGIAALAAVIILPFFQKAGPPPSGPDVVWQQGGPYGVGN